MQLTIDETAMVAKLLGPSGVMIDVGAHWGSSAIHFLRSKGWRVIAFEPDLANRKKLVSAFRNQIATGQLVVEETAVTEEGGEVDFFTSPVSSGISSLTPFHDSHSQSYKVQAISLRTYLEEHLSTEVDFLKIDTEGMDLFVLRGFPFERYTPKIIECEFEDYKTQPLRYDWKDLAEFLVEKNYEVWVSEWFPVDMYGVSHSWRCAQRFPCELHDNKAWGNLIAVHKDTPFVSDEVRKSFAMYSVPKARAMRFWHYAKFPSFFIRKLRARFGLHL